MQKDWNKSFLVCNYLFSQIYNYVGKISELENTKEISRFNNCKRNLRIWGIDDARRNVSIWRTNDRKNLGKKIKIGKGKRVCRWNNESRN